MFWRMFLRWLGRWIAKEKPDIAKEIDAGIDAEIPEASEKEKKPGLFSRIFTRKSPESTVTPSRHIQSPLIHPKPPYRPPGQRGGNPK